VFENIILYIDIMNILHSLKQITSCLIEFFPKELHVLILDYIYVADCKYEKSIIIHQNKNVYIKYIMNMIEKDNAYIYNYYSNVLTIQNIDTNTELESILNTDFFGGNLTSNICIYTTSTNLTKIYVKVSDNIYIFNENCVKEYSLHFPSHKIESFVVTNNTIYVGCLHYVDYYSIDGRDYISRKYISYYVSLIRKSDNLVYISLYPGNNNEFGDKIYRLDDLSLITFEKCDHIYDFCVSDGYFYILKNSDNIFIHNEYGGYVKQIECDSPRTICCLDSNLYIRSGKIESQMITKYNINKRSIAYLLYSK